MILLIIRYPWKGRNVQIPRLCFGLPLLHHAPEFRQLGIDRLVGAPVVAGEDEGYRCHTDESDETVGLLHGYKERLLMEHSRQG